MFQIPDDKRYFRIGEASRIIGVEPYVLRYWENEFSQIRPQRADSKQRTYQKNDLEVIFEIKRLLYEEKMTIEGAKKRLRQEKTSETVKESPFLEEVKNELRAVVEILSQP
jgi:DNA-binding transcriptional MerR regulator